MGIIQRMAGSLAAGLWNDCASSMYDNARYCEAVVYEHSNYGGSSNWWCP